MKRFFFALGVFAVLATGVGFLLSGKGEFAWGVALGLFGLALIGESFRLWIRRGRARTRQSSEFR
ncbi:hypothetical protein [Kribbella sp. NPDC006257]|jgi:hypothetical protein|uniref:hypothetical protein n=1 Tax=Kribbella sp. NPDC006257 TaxID=3156738 RepID=UPI0033B5BD87